jgi:hypothetical protein
MALTRWSAWSVRFHDWTSYRAWPREVGFVTETRTLSSPRWGDLRVTHVQQGFYSTQHPKVEHKVVTTAGDFIEAMEFAERWFDGLADEFGERFLP